MRNGLGNLAGAILGGAGLIAFAGGAAALEVTQPQPWQINLQPAASPIMEMIHRFNNGLLIVVTLIVLFVLALLVYVMLRFNARANPVPTRTSHNTLVEVLWTIVPILILVGIAIPSFSLLFAEHDPARVIANYDPSKALTIKATGSQWYWTYEYPDNGDVSFDSNMLQEPQRTDKANQPRLLAGRQRDGRADRNRGAHAGDRRRGDPFLRRALARLQDRRHPGTAERDLVPGRARRPLLRPVLGALRQSPSGDPNDLHGHSYMPIAVRAVAPDKFAAWVAAAKTDLPGAYKLLAESDRSAAPVKVAGE